MAALPGRHSWLRSAGQADVKMWLRIGGDSLQSIAGPSRFVRNFTVVMWTHSVIYVVLAVQMQSSG
jgi:hypothetical protein